MNKSLPVLTVAAALLAAQCFLAAQSAPPTATPAAPAAPIKVRPIRLEIDRKVPESMQLFVGGMEATEVDLYIKPDGKTMLEADKSANYITSFTDDVGTDLAKVAAPAAGASGGTNRSTFAARNPLITNLRVTDDGQAAVLTIRSTVLPAADAAKILIRGAVPIICGTHSVKDTQNNVALVKDASVTFAGHPAKIDLVENEGDQLAVALSSSQPFSTIKTVRFLAADGHEIKSKISSRSSFGFTGAMTYSISFMLDEKVSKTDIECTYWDKTETVTVPVDFAVGVGL